MGTQFTHERGTAANPFSKSSGYGGRRLTKPGHIALHVDGDPLLQRGIAPNFRPMSVVAKRLSDQDATWHGGRPRPKPHCLRWGPSCYSPKGTQPPIFGPCQLWPNGWMHQDMALGTMQRQASAQATVLNVDPATTPAPQKSGTCLLWQNGRPSQFVLSSCSVMISMR